MVKEDNDIYLAPVLLPQSEVDTLSFLQERGIEPVLDDLLAILVFVVMYLWRLVPINWEFIFSRK